MGKSRSSYKKLCAATTLGVLVLSLIGCSSTPPPGTTASTPLEELFAEATYETSIYIDRPLDVTFAYVSNFENAPSWDPQIVGIKQLGPLPLQVGTTVEMSVGPNKVLSFVLPYRIPEFVASQQGCLRR